MSEYSVSDVAVAEYTVPTEQPEADGTLAWDETVVVVVRPRLEGGVTGLGFAYGSSAVTALVRDELAPLLHGLDCRDTAAAWLAMVRSIRNLGRPGIASMAIAAVDIALWDTKARAMQQPLHRVLGSVRDAVPVYGSGGFTSYSDEQLVEQLRGWVDAGIPRVKMKIGTDRGASWLRDVERVRTVRDALGADVELFVDANGAYDRKQALRLGELFAAEFGVTWFEEPVTSDDLEGLAMLRGTLPIDVTAGEYGYTIEYFEAMLAAGAVDVLQADVSRCAGVTEWLRVAGVAAAHHIPFSAHCGPSLHAHVAAVPPNLRHIEWFHDHVRIDSLLFEGALQPVDGVLRFSDRPGLGLSLRPDAERWRSG
ncbi:MAG: mandelate racemase [Candidatus Dormibacteraeota bacterium]|nr:mandelate racemase [Candidatus Dormibacteraeota bacterium]MBV8445567.1 mandelate racemase [Candidatus Dormibacteraeota bacterium]